MIRSILVATLLWAAVHPAFAADAEWFHFGGDEGGSRFSSARQITPENVGQLIPAWAFHTGHLKGRSPAEIVAQKLEATPILVAGNLIACTPFNEVIALDPSNGDLKWRFDPKVRYAFRDVTCRGVTAWIDPSTEENAACHARILTGTNDARVIAIDAATGRSCEGFGEHGEVRIQSETPLLWAGELQINSPPVVVRGTVIVGSAIADNMRSRAPRGTVRAFDVRTGAPRWSWDPIPVSPSDPAAESWGEGWRTAGHANVWAPMSVDEQRGLVFLPTSSPSPDYFGGLRPGDNRYANSVVALDAATGELRWAYQTVHHDLWDFDLPAQPTLVTLDLGGRRRDVVIQPTKQGFLFVLDRDTGVPVFPVEERPVPQDGGAGEWISPTQPVPTHLPALAPQHIAANEAYGLTPWDRGRCRDEIRAARNEGLYTPPSEQGTIKFPLGAFEWGGVAYDSERHVLYANTQRFIQRVRLVPADRLEEMRAANLPAMMKMLKLQARFPGKSVSPQAGTPYVAVTDFLLSPLGLPCNPPPWGTLAALDLESGRILWESPVGTTEEKAPLGLALNYGAPNTAGATATASGLVFVGSVIDRYLRAYDARTGREIWQGRLPATSQATPMTYEWQGRQFVVIAAGGVHLAGTAPDDSIVAFALPRTGEAGPSLWSRTVDRPGGRFKLKIAGLVLAVGGIYFLLRRRATIRARTGVTRNRR